MAKLGELFGDFLQKVGIDVTDVKFKDVLSVGIEVADDTATTLRTGLMTLNEAKNNTEVKTFFTKNALDSIDKITFEEAKKLGIDESSLKELLAGSASTFARLPLVMAKLAEIKAAKANADTPEDKKKYTDQINALTAEAAQLKANSVPKADHDSAVANYEAQLLKQDFHFNILKNPLPGVHDSDVEVAMAEMFVNKALEAKNAKAVRKDGKIIIVNKDDEAINILDEKGQPLQFGDLTKSALAGNKFLKVSPPANPAGGNQNPANPGQGGQQAPKQNAALQNAMAGMDETIALALNAPAQS